MVKVWILVVVLIYSGFGWVDVLNPESEIIPGEYIVTYHFNVSELDAKIHWEKMSEKGVEFLHVYNNGFYKGFAGKISNDILSEIQKDDYIIQYIEHNSYYKIHQTDCSGQTPIAASWGLSRLSYSGFIGNGLPASFTYDPNGGLGVRVYIVDTGIYTDHVDFEGRASWGANFASSTNVDGNGHGTFVAGLVGGSVYGVAKKASVVAVKVLQDNGAGTFANVIAGINWVTSDNPGTKRIMVMSIGGSGRQVALEAAINNSVANNVAVISAAGGSNADACNFSPCGFSNSICIGATILNGTAPNIRDARAPFSSYGSCVDLFAPGSSIKGPWIGSPDASITISGSSASAPFVGGLAATLLYKEDLNPAQIQSRLQDNAQKGIIDNVGPNSPNLLAYNNCNPQS